jgi:succinate dehydrogenase / fumarate reductase iron-sulfur subunit
MDTAIVRVLRFNPDLDRRPRLERYQVPLTSDTTVLDALHWIKTEVDGSLTFRRSCRHAICGSCAMNVNGRNVLVCKTSLTKEVGRGRAVTVKPLPYLPILKDLVVDRSFFWDQYLRVKPWLVPPVETPMKEFRMLPEEVAALQNAETCIMCGACYSACQVVALTKEYIGPHALLKAFLRVLDPRDSIPGERLADVSGHDGAFRCHSIFNCIEACPKGLNPTKAIETLRRLAEKRGLFEAERRQRQAHLSGAGPSPA